MFARAAKRSPPSSTVTTGFAFRLWNQPGFVGDPPLDAMITRRSPSREYTSGLVRSRPLLAPLVVSRRTSRPRNGPFVTLPCARKSAMRSSLKAIASGNAARRAPIPAAVRGVLVDELARDDLADEAEG